MSYANWIPKNLQRSDRSDIPVKEKIFQSKSLKNLDIFSNFVYNNFSNSLFSSNFPSYLEKCEHNTHF